MVSMRQCYIEQGKTLYPDPRAEPENRNLKIRYIMTSKRYTYFLLPTKTRLQPGNLHGQSCSIFASTPNANGSQRD